MGQKIKTNISTFGPFFFGKTCLNRDVCTSNCILISTVSNFKEVEYLFTNSAFRRAFFLLSEHGKYHIYTKSLKLTTLVKLMFFEQYCTSSKICTFEKQASLTTTEQAQTKINEEHVGLFFYTNSLQFGIQLIKKCICNHIWL